jgi:hypothetical protein
MGLGGRRWRLGLGSERCMVLNQGNGGCEDCCSGWRVQSSHPVTQAADSNQGTTNNDFPQSLLDTKSIFCQDLFEFLPLVLDSAADVRKLVVPRCD